MFHIPHMPIATRVARAALALLAFALAAALATAPAHAARLAGGKPTGSPAARRRSRPGTGPFRPRPSALTGRGPRTDRDPAADRRLCRRHGTKYTFASYLDSAGTVVLDTNAPASVMSGLTSLSDAGQRERSARHRSAGRPSLTRSTAATTSRPSGVARESRTRAASAPPATRSRTRPGTGSASPPVTASPTARTRWSNPACAPTARSPGGACRRSPGTRWTWSCSAARATPAGSTPAAS